MTGDFLNKAQRYERTAEFLDIVTPPVARRGRHEARAAPAR